MCKILEFSVGNMLPTFRNATFRLGLRKPVWQYQFERTLPGTGAVSTRHSGELPYVLGAPQLPGDRMMGANFGVTDVELSKLMQVYWTNFAKNGDPQRAGASAVTASRAIPVR
jgi:carboxylesterase type B